jgi:hypothetical protein
VADRTIGPGKVATLVFGFPSNIPGYVPGYENCTYVGSATFTVEGDPNAKLAAISNQITTGYRDGLAVVSIAGTR